MSSSTPSIRIDSQHSSRYSSHSSHSTFAAGASPMAISGSLETAPPPLPPPTHLPDISAGRDVGWQWGNEGAGGVGFGRQATVIPGSSLLGSTHNYRQEKDRDDYPHSAYDEARRGSSISTVTYGRDQEMGDEGTSHSDEDGVSSRRSSNYRLQSERQLEQRTLETSSNNYDKQLLSRIGGPNTPKRLSVSYSTPLPEFAHLSQADHERRNSQQLKPLSLPERRHAPSNSMDSPGTTRWTSSGAVSPGFTGFWAEHGPTDGRTPATRHGSLTFDDSASHRGSYDHSMFTNEDLMEDGQMSSLNIHDRSPSGSDDYQVKAGTKRRASSPPREGAREERSSTSSASGQSEIYHRRSMHQLPNRGSPVSRFHPNHSSVSSTSSLGPRHGSLGSSLGIVSIPSSATSYGSGRLSPSALSPAFDPGQRLGTPYEITKGVSATPQQTLSGSTQSKLSSENMTHSRHGSLSRMQGAYLCECCPKKPKKFDTYEELRIHESEKQYTCAYCPNRFKNKNEAERHQNSLHLRLHSWSCAALAGPEAAYHASSSGPGSDVCGYCGEEYSNPPQWDVRAEHLNQVHKFGECNQAKKFYRADHFRQHLKHSHFGTSGKWTNVLETACMQDEPPPEKRTSPTAAAVAPGGQVPPALMVTTTGLGSGARGGHGVLAHVAETPNDS